MEALMEAVGMETKRSNSVAGDEDDDEMEPSTAGSPLGIVPAPTHTSKPPSTHRVSACSECNSVIAHSCTSMTLSESPIAVLSELYGALLHANFDFLFDFDSFFSDSRQRRAEG